MSYVQKLLVTLVCCLVWFLQAAAVVGQTSPPKQLSNDEFVKLIETRLKDVPGIRELDEPAKAKVSELYQQALRETESAKTWAAKTVYFEKQAADAPAELQQTKATLAALPAKPSLVVADNLTLPQIEQEISKRESELGQWQTALTDLEAEPKRRSVRRVEIPKLITAAREKLAEVNTELQAPAAADENAPAADARRIALLARRRNVEQELLACDTELKAYEALAELLPLRRDLAARRAALAEQAVKEWQEIANQRRKKEAEQQAQQASWEAGQAPPAVKRLAEQRAQLADMRKTLAQRIAETTQQLDQTKQDRDTLKKRFDGLREREDIVGLTNAIGLLLRKECETLPNLRALRQNIAALQQNISQCQLSLLQLRDQRAQFSDPDSKTRELLAGLNWAQEHGRRGDLEAVVREAVNTERQYLDDLIADNYAYLTKLSLLYAAERHLIEQAENYAGYINERVLWIASTMTLDTADIRRASEGLWWLAGPDACFDVGRTLTADAARNPWAPGLATCLFLSLAYWQFRLRTRLREVGEKAARGSCYRFLPTLEAAILTLALSVVWPGVFWYVGWRLLVATDASELCRAVGAGLMAAAQVHLVLAFLRQTCCGQGLAEAHFGWPAGAIKSLRQNLRWLGLPLLPAIFVAVAMNANARWDSSLGRVSFMVALVLTAIFLQRILRPKGGVVQAALAEQPGGWLSRFRYVWYLLAVLAPLTLAAMAAVGYYYTAQQLAQRLVITAYLLVSMLLIRSLLLRWTVVSQRRLAIEQARERRTAAQNETPLAEESPVSPSSGAATKPQRDLGTIIGQTRRFVGYLLTLAALLGAGWAWVDVLPAFRILNQVPLWPTSDGLTASLVGDAASRPRIPDQIAGATAIKGTATPESSVSKQQVDAKRPGATLGDLGLAILVLLTTFIAAKNIPGLLEVAVSRHLPLDAGARYAVVTVSRYFITIVGTIMACGAVGIGWSKVQLLVAAMSLGLGFGLQEIFAHFISGLIILFERPVRVGDVITIGDVSGVVSRIHLRTTTVTDWDRKELIIPNKEFITGRVLNWTLSDPVNRVVINVGVAYGSDTQRAVEILQAIARGHPNVLDDPPPRVTLESFGPSAMNLLLKFFLPNLENRGTVIHEVHMAIDLAFREAGIEIAFPQQDVHVRSVDVGLPLAKTLAAAATVPWPPAGGQAPPATETTRHAA